MVIVQWSVTRCRDIPLRLVDYKDCSNIRCEDPKQDTEEELGAFGCFLQAAIENKLLRSMEWRAPIAIRRVESTEELCVELKTYCTLGLFTFYTRLDKYFREYLCVQGHTRVLNAGTLTSANRQRSVGITNTHWCHIISTANPTKFVAIDIN